MSDAPKDEILVPLTLDEANEVIADLKQAIKNMDATSQDSLDKIESLSKLMIKSIYSPEGISPENILNIVFGLRLISELAQICQNDITAFADGEYCFYRDEDQRHLEKVIHSHFRQLKNANANQEATNHG